MTARTVSCADKGRETGLGGDTPLKKWVAVASKRLAPKGQAHFVQRADRLADLLSAVHAHLGSIEVQPLCARRGRAAHLVLGAGKKIGTGRFSLTCPNCDACGRTSR